MPTCQRRIRAIVAVLVMVVLAADAAMAAEAASAVIVEAAVVVAEAEVSAVSVVMDLPVVEARDLDLVAIDAMVPVPVVMIVADRAAMIAVAVETSVVAMIVIVDPALSRLQW